MHQGNNNAKYDYEMKENSFLWNSKQVIARNILELTMMKIENSASMLR